MFSFKKLASAVSKQFGFTAKYFSSIKTREINHIENMVGSGFLSLEVRRTDKELFYCVKAKGGNSTVVVGFTKEQFKLLAKQIDSLTE